MLPKQKEATLNSLTYQNKSEFKMCCYDVETRTLAAFWQHWTFKSGGEENVMRGAWVGRGCKGGEGYFCLRFLALEMKHDLGDEGVCESIQPVRADQTKDTFRDIDVTERSRSC